MNIDRRRLYFFILLISAILGACSTTREAAQALQFQYIGKNSDEFFAIYGPPSSEYGLESGDRVFRWNSGKWSNAYAEVFCEVQLLVSRDNKIKSIAPINDSIGKWQTSRCAEIFSH